MSPTSTSYRVRARNLAPDSDNRIHADDVAQQFGFSGALVPGVDVFAYATHPLVERYGDGFLSTGRLQLRFRRPVYDGDDVTAVATPDDDTCRVEVAGGDGEARARGTAWRRHDGPGDLRRFTVEPLPAQLLPTGPEPLPTGAFGSVDEPVEADRHATYLEGISEPLDVYRVDRVVHPGALLRAVNQLLMANVALGPWIHTASDCRFLSTAQWPCLLHADGIVTETYERNGNAYVRYDALVRADGRPVLHVDHCAIYRLGGATAPGGPAGA